MKRQVPGADSFRESNRGLTYRITIVILIKDLNYLVLPLCMRGGQLYEEFENGHFNPGEYFSSGRRNGKSAGIESQPAICGSNC